MKTIVTFTTILFFHFIFIFSHLSASQWNRITSPFGGNVSDFYVYDDYVYANTAGNGIYISSNLGESWQRSTDARLQNVVNTLAMKDNGELLAYTSETGLIHSIDHGQNWTQISSPLKGGFNNLFVVSDSVYIASNFISENIISVDAGVTWNKLPGPDSIQIYVLAKDKNNTLYGVKNIMYKPIGITKSSDLGKTWTDLDSTGFTGNYLNNINFNSKGWIYVCSSTGLLRSKDDGKSWTNIAKNFTVSFAQDLLLFNDSVLVLCTSNRCSISTDYGDTWQQINNTYINSSNHITKDKTDGIILNNQFGFWRSTDLGLSWKDINYGFDNASIYGLMFLNDDNLIAFDMYTLFKGNLTGKDWKVLNRYVDLGDFVESPKGDIFVPAGKGGMYRSTNRGESFEQLSTAITYGAHSFTFDNKGNSYCLGSSKVVKSTDNGDTWSRVKFLSNYNFNLMLKDSKDNLYFMKSSEQKKIYKLQDGDSSLVEFVPQIGDNKIDYFFINNKDEVYLMCSDTVIYKTTTNFDSLKQVMKYGYTWNMKFNKFGNPVVTTYDGIKYSNDGGNTWTFIKFPGYNSIVNCTFNSKNILYVSTLTGIYYYDEPTFMNEELDVSLRDEIVVFPNPTTDFIEISYPHLERGSGGVDIKIMNIFGEIQSSSNPTPTLPASREGVRIDVTSLAPGIYFVRIGDKVGKFVKM